MIVISDESESVTANNINISRNNFCISPLYCRPFDMHCKSVKQMYIINNQWNETVIIYTSFPKRLNIYNICFMCACALVAVSWTDRSLAQLFNSRLTAVFRVKKHSWALWEPDRDSSVSVRPVLWDCSAILCISHGLIVCSHQACWDSLI